METQCEDNAAKAQLADSTAQYGMPMAAHPAKSCLCLSKSTPIRKYCLHIINNILFERFIFITILCNCVTLALSSTRQDFSLTHLGKVLAIFEYIYMVIFTVEMIIKVIAMGFVFGRGTYLRDGWNVLDFLVVVMGYVSLLSPSNLTALRAFRAMRPLRTINRVKGMKVLVNSMIGSLPLLVDVFLLCAFSFFIFSLVAVQLFAGVLRNRCGFPNFSGSYKVAGGKGGGDVVLANVSYAVPDDQLEDMCSGRLSSEVMWYVANGAPLADPGMSYAGRICNNGMYCTSYGNPYDGMISYDNILWSWLTIFQHITLAGWCDVMYMVMDAVNYWVWIFYAGLIVFGAFFLVNLALAVLAVNFSADNQQSEQEEEQLQWQQEERREKNDVVEVLQSEDSKAGQRGTQTSAGKGLGLFRSEAGISTTSRLVAALKVRRKAPDEDEDTPLEDTRPPPDLGYLRRQAWRIAVSRGLELTTAALILVNAAVMCINWHRIPYKVEQATNYINYALTVYFAVDVTIRLTAFGVSRFFRSGMNIFDLIVVMLSLVEMIIDLLPSVAGLGPLSVLRAFRLLRIFRLARHWRELNALLTGMVKSVQASIMLVGLMLLFLFVAALVGMQLFGYQFMFCDYVEGASALCPLGQRVWGDCPNHFYCYLPCSEDQYGNWVDAQGSFYNGLAYCDRFCAAADPWDTAAASTGANTSTNITVRPTAAADAGRCEYLAMVGKSQVPRANFDNVMWGLFSVFQVLTGENWNDIMVDAMRVVSPWSSLYFVVVILVGNYLVFNLFIAILLDNLNTKMEDVTVVGASSFIGSSKHEKKAPSGRRSTSAAALNVKQLDWEAKDAAAEKGTDDNRGGSGSGSGSSASAVAKLGGDISLENGLVGDTPSPRVSNPPPGYRAEGWGWGWEEGSPEQPRAMSSGVEGTSPPERIWRPEQQQQHVGLGPVHGANVLGAALPSAPRHSVENSLEGLSATSTQSSGLRMPLLPSYGNAGATAGRSFRPSARGFGAPSPGYAAGSFHGQNPSVIPIIASSLPYPTSQAGPVAESMQVPGAATGPGGSVGVIGSCGGDGNERTSLSQPPRLLRSVSFCSSPAGKRLAVSYSASVPPPVATASNNVTSEAEPAVTAIQRERSIAFSSQPSFRAATDVLRSALQSFSSLRGPLSRAASAASIGTAGSQWRDEMQGRSLLLFSPVNCFRRGAATVIHNPYFEAGILLLILTSCVCLVLDAPGVNPGSNLAKALRILDYIFTGAFTLEALLKIVTFGFAFTNKSAYVRSAWNVLDLFIVLLGWALIIVEAIGQGAADNLKVLRVLRAMRALRPLRAVQRFPGLRVVVTTLFAVMPSMVNVALVCVFFYLIFAILAVNLFKGKLFSCIDAASGERIDPFYVLPPGEVLTRAWCEEGTQSVSQSAYHTSLNMSVPKYAVETQWVNPKANFDNVGIAMLSLFQTATLSLWVDITFAAVDAVAVDKQPLWNHSPWVVLFFVAFIVVCSFFVLNLFIGVTLDKFAELQQEQDSTATFLTPQQQSWVAVQRLLLRSEAPYVPPRPPGRLRGAVYSVAGDRRFETFMLLVILANVVFIALVHADMSASWQAVMSWSNVIFTCIFVVEAALKIVAFGPRGYFRDGWNCFDFFVAAVSVASVALDFSDTRNLSFMPVLRVLRVVRVIRLVRQATGMRKLLSTLITSLPALANVGGVMLLIFFIFAVFGVNLFAGVKHGDNLSRHANFDSFPNAMLLLFRMLTGEGWDAVMQECMNTDDCIQVLQDLNVTSTSSLQPGDASSSTIISLQAGTYLDPSDPLLATLPANTTDDQCPLSPVVAVLYFPSFVVLCTFIMLQLVIAVLRENLIESDNSGSESEAKRLVPRSAVDSFTAAWSAAVAEAARSNRTHGGGGSGGGSGGAGGSKGGGSRDGRGLLHASRLPAVLAATQPPLGAYGSASLRQELQKLLLRLRIPLYEDNTVSYMETLYALARSICATPLPAPEQDKLHRRLSKRLPRSQPHAKYTAAHYHAANSVAAAIRGFLLRHNIRGQLEVEGGSAGLQTQQPSGEVRDGVGRGHQPSVGRRPQTPLLSATASRRLAPIVSSNGAVVQLSAGTSRPVSSC